MTVPSQRNAPKLNTRRPTGKPSWPIVLLAGARKAGKSYCCAEASSSPLIGRTIWVPIGEDAPDEEGSMPGADFEIVVHDGTFRGILEQIQAATAAPKVEGKPNLLVIDSFGRMWDLLSGMAQVEANRRAAAKAAKYGRPASDEDATINMDLWNVAKERWQTVLDVLRAHEGPTIVTAMIEKTTVMNDKGDPTGEKDWKTKAEKNLGGDVGVIVEMPCRGEVYLSGVRSLKFKSQEDRTLYPGFTMERLWTDLGVTEAGATSPRQHTSNLADRTEHIAVINQIAILAERVGRTRDQIKAEWAANHDGQYIGDATALGDLELLRDDLQVVADLAERQAAVA